MGTNAIKFWAKPKKNLNAGSLKDDKTVGFRPGSLLKGVKNVGASNQTYGPGNQKKMGL